MKVWGEILRNTELYTALYRVTCCQAQNTGEVCVGAVKFSVTHNSTELHVVKLRTQKRKSVGVGEMFRSTQLYTALYRVTCCQTYRTDISFLHKSTRRLPEPGCTNT